METLLNYIRQRALGQGQPNQGSGQLGSAGNPSNYNSGPNQAGFGGPGEIAGGGMVPLTGINLPYFQQDRNRLQGLLTGQSPFASQDWNGLVSQLTARANGTGPSLAEQEYRNASGDQAAAFAGAAHGGASPASFRQAAIQQGQIGQGLASGVTQARTNEQTQAQGALAQALGARDQLNQGAYLNILGQQLGLSAEQLKALQGDQSYGLGEQGIQEQMNAAKWNAIAGLLGSAGSIIH